MTAALKRELEPLVTEVEVNRERFNVPGLAIGVAVGEQTWMYGTGVSRTDRPEPVDPHQTLFQVGSVSKLYTCAALMRLVELGAVELQAPVRRYLPEFTTADETVAQQVTLLHLMGHRSGIESDLFVDTGSDDGALARAVERMRELEQIAPLGRYWSYCNAGFFALGRVIEVVTGQTFEAALEHLVLAPLGLRDTLLFSKDVARRPHAVGHVTTRGETRVFEPWDLPRASHPVLGLSTTVADLVRWGQSFIEGTLLARASIDHLFTRSNHLLDDMGFDGAITWAARELGGELVVTSRGTTTQVARLTLVPGRKRVLAILANSMRGEFICRSLTRTWLQQCLGAEIVDPEPIQTTRAALAEYAGVYQRRGTTLKIELAGDRVRIENRAELGFPDERGPCLRPSRVQEYALCAGDRMVVEHGPLAGMQASFYRDDRGAVRWVRVDGRLHRRGTETAAPGPGAAPHVEVEGDARP